MDRYVYDGLRRCAIEQYTCIDMNTGEVLNCEYDVDRNSWVIFADVTIIDGDECKVEKRPVGARYSEKHSQQEQCDMLMSRGVLYKCYEYLGDRSIMHMDDNFADFLWSDTKTQIEEICVEPATDCEYHRITVKAGDGFVTTIYCLTDDDNFIEYTGEVARKISEGNEWTLVSIS